MKLSAAFSLFGDLNIALKLAFMPTLRDLFNNPFLALRPASLSRIFMGHVWVAFGPGTDEAARPVKTPLITPNAKGVVLDLGAGHGHTVNYLNRSVVTKYVALEPNKMMHPQIREIAGTAGYNESDGSLLVLSCGAEDTLAILSALDTNRTEKPVDTIISILTLCSIPSPEQTITRLVRDILKPGGQLLFYEHVLSPRKDVAWWQRLWTPLWSIPFDGCRLDRPTHLLIQSMKDVDSEGRVIDMWSEGELWGKDGEPEEHLFWHRVGKFIKRS